MVVQGCAKPIQASSDLTATVAQEPHRTRLMDLGETL
jgi:hypothetical protein